MFGELRHIFYLYWTKVKTLHVKCSQSIYKGNKNVIQQMIYIQVKWLGYASKQMGSGCGQRRRPGCHSNVIGVQFLLSTFWTHNLPCFSHQKSVRRTPNSGHIAWASSMDITKSQTAKGLSHDLFENQCWNMDSHQISNLELLSIRKN